MPGLKDLLVNGFFRIFATERQFSDGEFLAGFLICTLVCIAAGYLLGSINTAIIVSKKVYGEDIREKGSTNAGMTNMFRIYGKKGGFLTLLGDFLKTLVSVAIGYLMLGHDGAYIAGLFCILGHVFPVFYKFKGGKGVLAAAVTILLCDPVVFCLVILVFAIVLLGSKMVSMASVMSALMFPLFVDIWYRINNGGESGAAGLKMIMALLVTVVIVTKHIPNLKRIYAGQEPKITLPWEKKKKNKDK